MIGASHSPTPYKIKTPREEYVRCGADILLNGVERDLDGEGRCIVCGGLTHITIANGKVTRVQPTEAVLHVVEVRTGNRNVQIVCEGSPLFDREECLQTWLKGYKGLTGQVFKVQRYMHRASQLVAERVAPASPVSSNKTNVESSRVMRCADCGCAPSECAEAISAADCPNCRLESCCCWMPTTV